MNHKKHQIYLVKQNFGCLAYVVQEVCGLERLLELSGNSNYNSNSLKQCLKGHNSKSIIFLKKQ